MSKLVLFGVGVHTAKFISILKYFGQSVDFLADNDEIKIGQRYKGIDIISPETLVDMDCKIIITCVHRLEISRQMRQLRIGDKEISLPIFLQSLNSDGINRNTKIVEKKASTTICMDLYSGAKWGGAENWNLTVAKALANLTENIALVGDENICVSQVDLANRPIELKYFSESTSFEEMIDYFKARLPLAFVNSFCGKSFFAVLALKVLYPEDVKIITIVHNDTAPVYGLDTLFEDGTDKYVCVSSKIRDTLEDEYGVLKGKAFFMHQPINFDPNYQKNFNNHQPLRLGMATRLASAQKRCDLIPLVIEQLEEAKIQYVLNIAGDGELYSTIKTYIVDNKLTQKVRLLGHLENGEMSDFWKEQDIYLNISEFEGTSLAMLEAMGYGCVPIVTDVSGVRDFIREGYDGYICPVNDIRDMVLKIKNLDADKELLGKLGTNARKEILSKCRIQDYASGLLKVIGET